MDRVTALPALTLATAGLLLAGCRDHAKPARHDFVGRVVVGGVDRLRSPPLRACLRRYRGDLTVTRATRVVLREGRLGASLTVADPHSPWLYGCDFTRRLGKLCGGAVGQWRNRDLNDPRLDILCRDGEGRPLGAAWVVPLPRARSISVRERGHTEVYPVAGGLPVRIWTRAGVLYARSSALFDVTQRGADGKTLAHELLHAAVAG
jgi:hypothetical protein